MDLLQKTIHILVVSTYVVFGTLHAMDSISRKSTYKELVLQTMGHEDASLSMQENFASVVNAYRKKGWQVPETIMLKCMNKKAIKELQEEGVVVPNMTNDGIDIVHTTCDHVHLTDQEKRQLMAHEIAHVLLREHKWLNPHWYLEKYTHPVTLGVVCMGGLCGGLNLAALRKNKSAAMFIAGGIFYGISSYRLLMNARDNMRFAQVVNNTIISGIEFTSVKKLEEIECDLIAALVMPDGGKNGAALYQKNLELHGDKNGVNGSHPYLSTRVKYHTVIEWLQERIKDKT